MLRKEGSSRKPKVMTDRNQWKLVKKVDNQSGVSQNQFGVSLVVRRRTPVILWGNLKSSISRRTKVPCPRINRFKSRKCLIGGVHYWGETSLTAAVCYMLSCTKKIEPPKSPPKPDQMRISGAGSNRGCMDRDGEQKQLQNWFGE